MRKLQLLSILCFMLLSTLTSVGISQEIFNYKGQNYNVYPHRRESSPSSMVYSSINRKNKKNIEYLYKNERGNETIDEDEMKIDLYYFEMDVFNANRSKMKKKYKKQVRKQASNLFRTGMHYNQTITPSMDPIPDGKYVQFYKNIFNLDANGDILPDTTHIAGFFELKNNLLHGFSYWLSTSGDTIEQGYFSEGKRVGKWTFNENDDFWTWNLKNGFSYDKTSYEYKDGLQDGEYISYFNDTLIEEKGFYTAGEPSGEWFLYKRHFSWEEKERKIDYYLEKHFTYATPEDTMVSHKIMIRNTINRFYRNDTITMPPNIYTSQIDFNKFYKFYKPVIEDLELPEEKITSYDGEKYSGEDHEYYEEEEYDEMRKPRYEEGEIEIQNTNFNRDNKIWLRGKQYSKGKLIDSIGIQFKYKGIYEEFFYNGKRKYKYEIKNGELVSEDTVYWENGLINDIVSFDPKEKTYTHSTFDYAGKLIIMEKFDSLANFIMSTTKYERYPIVEIDGIKTEFHKDGNYYLYSNYDTLLKANITTPMYLFKSWYFDKKVCAESHFEPSTRELSIKINSLNGTPIHDRKLTFGEDYSFYSQRVENNFRDLQAVIISNATYDASVHNDSFPQSKMYHLRYFDETDDYVLNYKGKAYTGKFEMKYNASSPSISIKENKISMALPKYSMYRKLNKDYKKFQKNGHAKYKKYYDVLDISLNMTKTYDEMFPFLKRVKSEANFSGENDLYGDQEFRQNNKAQRITGQLENGKPTGKWLVYDLEGNIIRECNFENGEKQGEQKTFAIEYPAPKVKKHNKYSEDFYLDGLYMDEYTSERKRPEKKTVYLKQSISFNKGQQHGPEKVMDWEGNILYSANYKDGYMEGPVLERNELITTRSSYKDGMLDGILQTKLTLPEKDSITLYDLNFQNHQLQGESKSYHVNGKLAKRGFFLNNDPIDDYEAFDTLGFKYHYVKFLYTFPVEEKIWEENELSVRYLFDWQDSIYFRPNDLVEVPSAYSLLAKYGLMDSYSFEQPYYGRPSLIDKTGLKYHVTKYFPDQVISRDGPIDSGKKVGCWYYNNYAGQKIYDIEYFDTILKINDSIKFKAKGIRTDFDTLGNALHKSYVIEKIENYDCSHTDHYEIRQFMTIWQAGDKTNRFNGYVKNYYDDGTLQSEGNMKDGLPTGIWKYYTPNGMLNQVGEYVQGKRNGRWLKGDLSKTNYIGDICMNPNLPDLEKRVEYQENLLDINIRYFKLGKIVNSEFYDINMNQKNK